MEKTTAKNGNIKKELEEIQKLYFFKKGNATVVSSFGGGGLITLVCC